MEEYKGTSWVLLDFLKTFGTTTTNVFDLYNIADFLNMKIIVLMKDSIQNSIQNNDLNTTEPTKNNDTKNYIINYQNTDQNGSHWVAFTFVGNDGYYFDSYGLPPLDQFTLDSNITTKPYVKEYNKIRVQPDRLKFCGVLCIYFLYKMNSGMGSSGINFNETPNSFNKTIQEMEDLYEDIKD